MKRGSVGGTQIPQSGETQNSREEEKLSLTPHKWRWKINEVWTKRKKKNLCRWPL